MFWGDEQKKNDVLTDIVTDWFSRRARSGRTEILKNDDDFVDALAELNVTRMEESAAMARSQQTR